MAKKYEFTHPDDGKKYTFSHEKELSVEDLKIEKEKNIELIRYLNNKNITQENKDVFLQNFKEEKQQRDDFRGRGRFEDYTFNALAGGIRDAGEATAKTTDFLTKYDPRKNPIFYGLATQAFKSKLQGDTKKSEKLAVLTNAFTNKSDGELQKAYNALIPQIDDPKFPVAKFVRVIAQFLTPYSSFSALGKTRNVINEVAPILSYKGLERVGKEALRGGVAEQFAFNPEEERLSNLIQSIPSLQNPVSEFLAADPDDSQAKQRLKMAIEGSGLGVSFDLAFRVLGKIRGKRQAAEEVKNNIDKAEGRPRDPGVDVEQIERDFKIKNNPNAVRNYDDYIKEQNRIKENVKKDPIKFQGDSKNGVGTYGKNKFIFSYDSVSGKVNAFVRTKRQKDEIDNEINTQQTIRQSEGRDLLKDQELQDLRNKLSTEDVSRRVGSFDSMLDARNNIALRFVPSRKINETLNPKEPNVKRVSSLITGKFSPDDYGLEDVFGADYRKNFPYIFSKNVKPGDAQERAGEILTQAGFTGRINETTASGYNRLEQDEIVDLIQENRILPEDQQKYIDYQSAENNSQKIQEKLLKDGYTPEEISVMTEVQMTRALKNADEKEKSIESNISYFQSREGINSDADDVEKYYNAHTSRMRDESRSQIEQDARNAGASADEARAISNQELGVDEGFGGSYVGQGGGRAKTGGPEKAGNINLEKILSPEDVIDVLKEVVGKVDLNAARRIVPFGSKGEKLRALGKSIGLTPDDILIRKIGEAFNAEQIDAARVLHDEALSEVARLARKVVNDPSDANRVALKLAKTRVVAITEQIVGITAEAGRALRAFREFVGPAETRNKFISDYLKGAGGRQSIDEIALAITKIDDDVALQGFVKDTYKPTTLDKVQEGWIAALLSAPSTHFVNMISNGITATIRPGEYLLGALSGKLLRTKDALTVSEAGARALGTIYGAIKGMKAVGKNLLLGKSFDELDDPLVKLELSRQEAISGLKGDLIRIPGKLLTLEDAFFKTIGQTQEYFGRAMRQAKKEGKGVKRAFDLYKDKKKLGEDVRLAAIDEGRYLTFTKPVEGIFEGAPGWVNRNQWWRFIFPFVRTPINIVKFALGRTPLSLASSTTRKNIAKGGKARDLEFAKLAMGGLMAGGVMALASQGNITGRGPRDWKERQALRELGWRPYSIKVGDTYYSYNRFEPVGIIFGLSADLANLINEYPELVEKEDGIQEVMYSLIESVSENLTNKTFLTGLTGVVEVLSEPERYSEDFILRFLTSFVPTISKYVRQAEDPIIRNAKNIGDAFINKISPTVSDYIFSKSSKDLPPKRNIFGEIREYDITPSADGFTLIPINISEERQNPVFEEFLKLDYFPGYQSQTIDGIKLTEEKYSELLSIQQQIGAKRILESLVASPDFQNQLPYVKTKILEETISDLREKGREVFLLNNPEIQSEIINKKEKEITQIKK